MGKIGRKAFQAEGSSHTLVSICFYPSICSSLLSSSQFKSNITGFILVFYFVFPSPGCNEKSGSHCPPYIYMLMYLITSLICISSSLLGHAPTQMLSLSCSCSYTLFQTDFLFPLGIPSSTVV